MRDHPDAIDTAAARWVARLDRTPHDPALAAEIDAWASADPRRVGALLRARAVWEEIGRDTTVVDAPANPARRRLLYAGGSFAVAAGGLGTIWGGSRDHRNFVTAVGERRIAKLDDGSTILLNTASRTRVTMTPDRRSVSLEDGEAWFHVAKDKARPFVVAAGDIRVRAVGTAFAVRRFADRAEVTVTEGRVRIWSVAAPERFVMLDGGKQVIIADATGAAQAAVSTAKPAESLAWRKGEIVLDGMTLGDAAAEFNRYNARQLAVEAPLSERRIVGWFRTDDVDGFARSAAAMTGARIEHGDNELRLVE